MTYNHRSFPDDMKGFGDHNSIVTETKCVRGDKNMLEGKGKIKQKQKQKQHNNNKKQQKFFSFTLPKEGVSVKIRPI